MAGDFAVDLRDLQRVTRRYADAPKVIQREHTRAMTRARLLVQQEAQRTVVKDTRTLARSLGMGQAPNRVVSLAGAVQGVVGSILAYALPVEEGRRAGAAMPPDAPLRRWGRRHGFDDKAIFALRRKIAQRGIPARPYLRPALAAKGAAIRAEFAAANRRIVAELGGGR